MRFPGGRLWAEDHAGLRGELAAGYGVVYQRSPADGLLLFAGQEEDFAAAPLAAGDAGGQADGQAVFGPGVVRIGFDFQEQTVAFERNASHRFAGCGGKPFHDDLVRSGVFNIDLETQLHGIRFRQKEGAALGADFGEESGLVRQFGVAHGVGLPNRSAPDARAFVAYQYGAFAVLRFGVKAGQQQDRC